MKKTIRISTTLFLIVLVFSTYSCKKDKPLPPVLTTTIITDNSYTTATGGGNITSDGGAAITARGVCWGTAADPTIALTTKTTDGTGVGTFASAITALTAGTNYFVRAYATNSAGTSYGAGVSFTTMPATVNDVDGNVYHVVVIGTQVWMKENLKTTKYNDGTAIPNVTNGSIWSSFETGAYCDYNDDPSNSTTYGRLYNWFAIDNNASKVSSNGGKNVCPTGWHVPSDAEWTILLTYSGGQTLAGGKLKETGTAHWLTPNTGATNETGFTALPGGLRDANMGEYGNIGYTGDWWSTTAMYGMPTNWEMKHNASSLTKRDPLQRYGFSTRCIKD
jgi:uncharacterized protein (TIGR02145 family)